MNRFFYPITQLSIHLTKLVEEKLYARVLLGLFLGLILGIILSADSGLVSSTTSSALTDWIALPGNIFIRLVQMIMIPLVFASVIQGIAGGGSAEQLQSMGIKVALYFVVTTVFSIIIGVILALSIAPGLYVDADKMRSSMASESNLEQQVLSENTSKPIPQKISNILPSNPLQAMMSGEMLSIVIFAIIIGIALVSMPAKSASPVLDLLFSVQEICMTITRWAMKIAPFAVFGLICQITAKVGFDALAGLSLYILTVWAGLLLLLIFYMMILTFLTQCTVKKFFLACKDVLLLAFSMASSAAVLPLSLKTAEESLGVRTSVSRFVIPLGATINMNGTALYQTIATIFLAQIFGLDLNLTTILLLVTTTVAASIGTPSSPGAGIIILATILSSVGIPVAGIAMIIGVDNLLGMSRSAVNVAGDLTASVLFNEKQEKLV